MFHSIKFSLLILATFLVGCGPNVTNQFKINEQMAQQNNLGVGQMGQFDYAQAYTTFDELVTKYPEWQQVKINRIIALLNRNLEGDTEQALAAIEQVIQANPKNIQARYIRGLLKQHSGDIASAAIDFKFVLDTQQNDAYAAYFLAQGFAQQQQYQQALDWYQKAINYDPYLRSVYYGAFKASQQLRDRAKAKAYLQTFQKLKANPRAQLAEIKYTRMGPLAEVKTVDASHTNKETISKSPLFKQPSTYHISHKSVGFAANYQKNQTLLATFSSEPKLLNYRSSGFNESSAPWAKVDKANAIAWADVNNDGYTDAYLMRQGANQLWLQDSVGQFTHSLFEGIEGDGSNTLNGAFFDADHDGDLDLLLVNKQGNVSLLNNNLNGSFSNISEKLPEKVNSLNIIDFIVQDFDNDRDTDILLLTANNQHLLLDNYLLWHYQVGELGDSLTNSSIENAIAADINSDGYIELYTINENGQLLSWHRQAQGGYQQTQIKLPITLATDANLHLAVADVVGKGELALLVTTSSGWAVLTIKNDTATVIFEAISSAPIVNFQPLALSASHGPTIAALTSQNDLVLWHSNESVNQFVTLSVSGLEQDADGMRSNASGIGTKIALRTGSRWTLTNTFKQSSSAGQSLQPVIIGIGNKSSADFVALEWSDGVYQTELNLQPGIHHITETQRQLASCPVLFVWNGEKFEYVSDILGVAGIGFAIGPGQYAEPRPWENFMLPNNLLKSKDGVYELLLTEPMEEVMYLDNARLEVYDLPPGWHLALDERMGINAPFPTGEAFVYQDFISPLNAFNGEHQDVTNSILLRDNIAAPIPEADKRFLGLTKEAHQLTVTFSEPINETNNPHLLIDGWVEYPYSQTSFSAWQAGEVYKPASLEVRTPDGQWHMLYKDFGYPAGMPRQMSLPLINLPNGVDAIRLSARMEIFWDRIGLVYSQSLEQQSSTADSAIKREAPLLAASAEDFGFAKRSTLAQKRPHYDFEQSQPIWDTRYPTGYYSQLGDVTELVKEHDSALAIIGPGEGIRLQFAATQAPLKAGWQRVYVLSSKGWVKDMDMYTEDTSTVGPLPGEETKARNKLHSKYNTRFE